MNGLISGEDFWSLCKKLLKKSNTVPKLTIFYERKRRREKAAGNTHIEDAQKGWL
jgi:hypothetical protein